MPSSGIAGSYGSSIFSFLRKLYSFYVVVVSIYIASNSVPSTSSPTLVISCLFDNSHSDCHKVILFFVSFGYIPRSGTAGSYGGSIFNF